MTLIENYLRRQFKNLDNNIIKEFTHYLVDNNYSIDFSKMNPLLTDHLYLVGDNKNAHIYLRTILDEEDEELPTIIMSERGFDNSETSFCYKQKFLKEVTYYLSKKGEISINYCIYPNNNILEGLSGYVLYHNGEFDGYIIFPEYEDLELNNPYLRGIGTLKKRNLLVSYMGEIVNNSILTYYQKHFNDKEKIVKQP